MGDEHYFTNPRADKSDFTVVLDTDEPNDAPCLGFVPYGKQKEPVLSDFAPVFKAEGESLIFQGTAPREAQFGEYIPASHAVRPLDKSGLRNVVVFLWPYQAELIVFQHCCSFCG